MTGENNLLWLGVGMLFYSVGAILAFLFTFRPEIFVRAQAQKLRKLYKEQAQMSDAEIDRRVKSFESLFVIDSMSRFVNSGVEHPEEFPRLMYWYRGVGGFIWAILLFAVFFLIAGFVTGALSISR
jgi:hypothetical protein